jgi:hypothetical protein
MKHTLKIACALVAGLGATMLGGCEKLMDYTGLTIVLPADAAAISGPEGFFGNETVTLTAPEIEYADAYVWYFGDKVIDGETGRTIEVSDTGTYRVAGRNALGEGTASPAKILRLLNYADRLVGEWECKEYWVTTESQMVPETLYNNDHTVTIIRTGAPEENKIAIVNFFEANPAGTYSAFAETVVYEGVTMKANGDTVVATVDSENRTILIPTAWKFLPSWDVSLETELCPMVYDSGYADNVGVPFPPQQIVETEDGRLQIKFVVGPLTAEIGADRTKYPQTYMIAATSPTYGYVTRFARAIGTTWTKKD